VITADEPAGTLEAVATFDGPMPTGVTVRVRIDAGPMLLRR